MKISKKKLNQLIEQSIQEKLASVLKEAKDEKPSAKWAKLGDDVDDMLNDTIDKCNKLIEQAEEAQEDLLSNMDPSDDKMKNYISVRLSFLKQLRSRLAQKYEGLRRNT